MQDQIFKDPELEACPCCGGEAELVHLMKNDTWFIRCTTCAIMTDAVTEKPELLYMWSMRSNNEENEQYRGDCEFHRAETLDEENTKLINRLDKIQAILNGDEDDSDE